MQKLLLPLKKLQKKPQKLLNKVTDTGNEQPESAVFLFGLFFGKNIKLTGGKTNGKFYSKRCQ